MLPTNTRVKVLVERALPSKADGVAVVLAENDRGEFEGEIGEVVGRLIDRGVFRGKPKEVVGEMGKMRQVIVTGAGAKMAGETLREAGGAAYRLARQRKIRHLSIVVPTAGVDLEVAAEALVTGVMLAAFKDEELKGSAARKDDQPGEMTVTMVGEKGIRDAVERAKVVAEGQNYARTIATRPGNQVNPPELARIAQEMAKEVGLGCKVLDEKEMKRLGMGGILGVGSGSANPPRMIMLEHKGKGKTKGGPLLLVGKGITFDTGGISIKPAEKMGRMVFDKCGAMAVLGAMSTIARLKLPIHVVGILSSAENHVSGTAYRPGDILKMYNGVTVEVTNTDAEGRLVLGDALAYGIEQYKPSAVVELSTLTGGVVVALGRSMAGVMSNSDELVAELSAAASRSGEKFWRLPVGDEQRELMKSDFADIVNSGPREASPLQGGAFLSYFVPRDDSVPFAHVDIAGVADTDKEMPYYAKGATGWGVRMLVEWVSARAGV